MARRLRYDNYVITAAPRIGPGGWLRWAWRQVTSMRVALLLLLLLGLGAVPAAFLPQRPQGQAKVAQFIREHGAVGEALDRLGFLDVFGSPWFTAIYGLLFLSLIGCILPRTLTHARALREAPAAAPSSLARYEVRDQASVSDAQAAIARVEALLRPGRRGASRLGALLSYRLRVDERKGEGGPEIALTAEQGTLREWGNLAFHLSLVGILTCVMIAGFFGYRGQVLVIEGRSFTNSLAAYDSFDPGRAFDPARLEPFVLTLDDLDATFDVTGRGLAFTAHVTVGESGSAATAEVISVNRPLHLGGAKVYLQGNGYAPELTIRDSTGAVAFAGPVPFLPQDAAYTSRGVVKVPDVTRGEQFGLKGTLLPTAVEGAAGIVSAHPDPANPLLVFEVYVGDLGLDGGVPQNVYVLDESQLSPVRDDAGDLAVVVLRPGQTVALPDGLGTVTWESLPRFAAFDLRADPTLPWLLGSALLAILGLALSLFAPDRRLWVVARIGKTTVVTAAAYGPPHDGALAREVARVMTAIREEGA